MLAEKKLGVRPFSRFSRRGLRNRRHRLQVVPTPIGADITDEIGTGCNE